MDRPEPRAEEEPGHATPPRRAVIFDPFSGISGDMLLGAWIDLGLDRHWLLDVADRVGVRMAELRVEPVDRAGVRAVRVMVAPAGEARDAEPAHHRRHASTAQAAAHAPEPAHGVPSATGGEHRHGSASAGEKARAHGRPYSDIRHQIEESSLDERSKSLALDVFGRLAAAEGRVHGVPPDAVHFHEVGAADALLDICGGADGFFRLGIEEASTLPVGLGQGSIEIHHGRYPVPAPATAYLLEGTAVRHTGYPGELVTPTGAALLAGLCRGRPASGDATVERVGYGAGARDPAEHPNCLRVWLTRPHDGVRSAVHILQVDVDDMSPEYVPSLIDACLEAGALDATVQTVYMKKGRPAWRLECLVEPAMRASVEDAVFRHSSTIGLRSWSVMRHTLLRSMEERAWRGHRIRVKRSGPEGGSPDLLRSKAEYEDVVAAAAAEGMEPARVLRELRRAWPDLV
ncbi:MAG: LarC family nickel insertion protein [Gemmatimonadota bacterium]